MGRSVMKVCCQKADWSFGLRDAWKVRGKKNPQMSKWRRVRTHQSSFVIQRLLARCQRQEELPLWDSNLTPTFQPVSRKTSQGEYQTTYTSFVIANGSHSVMDLWFQVTLQHLVSSICYTKWKQLHWYIFICPKQISNSAMIMEC